MNNMLVPGSAGFIDSHVAEELVMRGYHVIAMDDLSDVIIPSNPRSWRSIR